MLVNTDILQGNNLTLLLHGLILGACPAVIYLTCLALTVFQSCVI